jgi:hypothetical protein
MANDRPDVNLPALAAQVEALRISAIQRGYVHPRECMDGCDPALCATCSKGRKEPK